MAHLCEEIENVYKRPIEASERSYVRNEVWTHSLSFAMGAWSSSATVRPASMISSRTLIRMSAQRSVNRREARRFIYQGVGQRWCYGIRRKNSLQPSQLHPIFSIKIAQQFPDQGSEQNARDRCQQRELRAQWPLPYRGHLRRHLWLAIKAWVV